MIGWILVGIHSFNRRSSLMLTRLCNKSPLHLSLSLYRVVPCQIPCTYNCVRPRLSVGCTCYTATDKHNRLRPINFVFAGSKHIQSEYGVEEQYKGYGYSEAHAYDISSSLYGRKMAYLQLLWPAFAPFKLARSSRLSGILDQRSGTALGGRVIWLRKMDNNQSTWEYSDEGRQFCLSRAKKALDVVPIQAM